MASGKGDKYLKVFTSKKEAKKYCKANYYDFSKVKSSYIFNSVFSQNDKIITNCKSFELEIK
jgi:hypothetical protein